MKKLFLLLFPVALMLAVVACEEKEPTPPEILNISAPVFKEINAGEKTNATVTYEIANAGDLKPTAKVEGEGFSISTEEVGTVTVVFTLKEPGTYEGKLIIAIGDVSKEIKLEAKVNEGPAQPETPETPETPDTPETPVIPDEPAFPALLERDYVICNYNIRYYNGSSDSNNKGNKAWPNRKAKVFEMIRNYDMDVCGLEEVTGTMATDIANQLTEYQYIGYGRDNGKQQGSGASGEQTGLIYKKDKFDKMDQGRFFLSNTPDKVSKLSNSNFNRMVAWVRLQDKQTGVQFYFFATHFDNDYDAKHVTVRSQQADVAIKKVPEIAGNLPYFFVGDFNCETSEVAYTKLSTAFDDSYLVMGDKALGGYVCNSTQLANSKIAPKCACEGNTYTGLYSSSDNWPKRIDLVLFDDTKATVSYYNADNNNMGLTMYPSDHLPVITVMTIK